VLIVYMCERELCENVWLCVCVSHHHTAETAGGGSFSERLSHISNKNHCQITHTGATVYRTHIHTPLQIMK